MTIAIAGIGLATAQRNSPAALPWTPSKWNVSRICYPAVDSSLTGAARWQALVKEAFANLGPLAPNTPLFVGSCNGDASRDWEQAFDTSVLLADTPWANERLPIFSSSCASGIHALYAAKQLISAGTVDEALVLAADILSQSNHDNFESLRVLAERPGTPWQSTSEGFILGEAAVVLKLVRAEEGNQLCGPELGSDLIDHDGLVSVIETLSPEAPALVFGQGTGPYQNDVAELAAISAHVDKNVPIATPLSEFGHTLGASGLLAVALGVRRLQNVLSVCRALNGACAATLVGGDLRAKAQRRKGRWQNAVTPGPLMNSTLKRVASEALENRPTDPPHVFILRMQKPLSPPASAIIGGRLLPSAVLEITPGFASQLVARCWGFSGPALCLVGDVDHDVFGLRNALHESGMDVFQMNLRGSGDNRVIEWNV